MLRKMGWGGAGLGAKEQGIEQPISGGEVSGFFISCNFSSTCFVRLMVNSTNICYHIIGWELTVEIYNVIFSYISNLQVR